RLPDAYENMGRGRKMNEYSEYLAMDPNSDGRLTIAEMEDISRKTFAIIDLDGNSILSDQESQIFQKALQDRPPFGLSCKIPAIAAEDRVVVIGGYDGIAVPDVTTAGQDEAMTAAKINVAKQNVPLHLF